MPSESGSPRGPRAPSRAAPTPRRKRAHRPWPRVDDRGIEAAKWQVWIGHQLRLRRRAAPDRGGVVGLKQEAAAARAGLNRVMLSQIENGQRRVDAVELRRLASVYGMSLEELGALFAPPALGAWQELAKLYEPGPEWASPPAASRRGRQHEAR